MRILHLISQRPDSTGSGFYLQELLTRAVKNGHRNHLLAGIEQGCTPHLPQLAAGESTYAEFSTPALPFPIVGMSDAMPYASSIFGKLTKKQLEQYTHHFTVLLDQVVRSFCPEIIHSHHLWLLTSLARQLFPDIPMLATCHGTDLRQYRNCPHLRDQVLEGCQKLDAVLALSRPQQEDIVNLYGIEQDKITVVGGGYNSEMFFAETKPAPPPVRLLYGGKLSNAKGVPWMLQAFNNLETPHHWHLDLAGGGDGAEYTACLQLARAMPANITIHGPLAQQDLAKLMRQAHVMVLPSLYEGLPLIVLEAVASGCHVLATDLPGTREIAERLQTSHIHLLATPPRHQVDQLDNDAAESFSREITAGLREMIARSQQHPNLSLTALQHRIDYFNWDQVYGRTEKIYNKLATIYG